MKILAIDSTAKPASVAVLQDKKVLAEFYINVGFTHSVTLMPMVASLLQSLELTPKDIDVFAANVGPGSFTGVRIGVATIKGMAFAFNTPCVPVSTLKSIANNFVGEDVVVCACMDARCNQVYNAFFKVEGSKVTRLCDDRAISLEDLKKEITKIYQTERIVLAGDGADLTFEFLANEVDINLAVPGKRYQNAVSTAMEAKRLFEQGKHVNVQDFNPTYLRLPQATRELIEKQRKTK